MTIDNKELEEKRRHLLRQFDKVTTAPGYAEYQSVLCAEIVTSENLLETHGHDKTARGHLKSHIHICRILGDAMAWRLLPAHTIKQLSKNLSIPPFLKNQSESTNLALSAVCELAARQGPAAIVCDLTHVLKIGDFIIPTDGYCPIIVEFKKGGDKAKTMSPANRAGRQMLRMHGTAEYLLHDKVKIFDEENERRAIDVNASPEHNWNIVATVCREALDSGWSFHTISKNEFIICLRCDRTIYSLPENIKPPPLTTGMVGGHGRYLEDEVTALIPTVANWPIGLREREALLVRDIDLVHIIDPASIVGFEEDGAKITAFDGDMLAYKIEAYDSQTYGSINWLTRWLYGYQTAESTCRMMTALCKRLIEITEAEFGSSNLFQNTLPL